MEQKKINLPDGFTVTAHTGCMNTKDNSLESVEVGLQNADIVEVDISCAADGTLVLFHGSTPPKDAVPLRDAFEILARYPDKRMNLDLKVFSHCGELQALAESCGILPQVFFTGVFKNKVDTVHADAPKIPYYLNYNLMPFLKDSRWYARHLVHTVRRSGAIGLNSNFFNATPSIVDEMHRAGLLVSLWTVKTEAQAETVLRLQPDNLSTRIPDVVFAKMNQLK